MRRTMALLAAVLFVLPVLLPAQLTLPPEIEIPALPDFKPLPDEDPDFNAEIAALVEECQLHEGNNSSGDPERPQEWSSICLVDLTDLDNPRVAGWKSDNFIYPASTYKLYVLGELIRQVCAGERDLDDKIVVEEHNVRSGSRPVANQEMTLSEILRLTMMYSDNTAANVAIDVADRRRASALLRAMGCEGSDITRKFLPRNLEDEGYSDAPGTVSSARHFATFLYAVETGAIGGGRGRGLIKGYMATDVTRPNRMRAGLPDSATLYSKTGWWSIYSTQVAIIEDGETKYILCVMTPYTANTADPRIADFTRKVHAMMQARAGTD